MKYSNLYLLGKRDGKYSDITQTTQLEVTALGEFAVTGKSTEQEGPPYKLTVSKHFFQTHHFNVCHEKK